MAELKGSVFSSVTESLAVASNFKDKGMDWLEHRLWSHCVLQVGKCCHLLRNFLW